MINNNANLSLVPFGKYKGQPIEVLANDSQYVDWALSQEGIKAKYPDFVNIVINNFQKPSETPDHNAMQVKFLDESYAIGFAETAMNVTSEKLQSVRMKACSRIMKAFHEQNDEGIKALINIDISTMIRKVMYADDALKNTLGYKEHSKKRSAIKDKIYLSLENKFEYINANMQSWCVVSNREFETKSGCDVSYKLYIEPWCDQYINNDTLGRHCSEGWLLKIEIKPAVSDDFPSVFRQMKRSKSNILFIKEYTGVGATKDELVQYFATNRIKVVFEEDLL
jgi:hypothetical protein